MTDEYDYEALQQTLKSLEDYFTTLSEEDYTKACDILGSLSMTQVDAGLYRIFADDEDQNEKNTMTREEKKEKMAEIISEKYHDIILEKAKGFVKGWQYNGKHLSENPSHRSNLLKFDANFFFDDFVYIYDTSFSNNCKAGIAFMLSGFYTTETLFEGKFYIAYKDIEAFYTYKDDKTKLGIKTTGKDYEIYSTQYKMSELKELIQKLIQIDVQCDTSYTSGSDTGKVKGLKGGAGHRQAYLAGQKSGYIRASREYESKLRRQAELFLEQRNKWKEAQQDYEDLLDEYEKTIVELENKVAELERSGSGELPEYQQRLDNVISYRDALQNLQYA